MKYEEKKLSELVDTISDTRKIDKDKVVLVNTSDVLAGEVLNHTYTENCNLRGQFKKRFKTDDILYSEIRPANKRFAYIDFDSEDYIASTKLMVLRRKSDKITNRYLYYCLTNDLFVDRMQHLAEARSGTFPQITFDVLKGETIYLPSIANQNKITSILDNINNKIRLNNEINNNLFELLKSDFKNKFYKKDEKDSFLSDYISETIGGDWGKESPEGNNNTKVYCVRGADIPSMEYGNKGNAPIRYILEKNYNNKKLNPNNIIIEISGGSPTQSTGRTAYITQNILDMYDFPLLCTNFCRAIETKNELLAPFVYMNLKLMYEDDVFFNWENGTTGIKNLALNDMLSNIEVKTPDENDLKEYNLLFNNIMNKISNNSNENIKLEQLRDTLLPKLMNGEIDLDNIEI